MSSSIRAIRGFRDIGPDEAYRHHFIEDQARDHFSLYGYREVRLPLLEPTELFARGIGEGTDIVEKEMYTFQDRNGTSLTLRPEGTASAMRAFLEGGWSTQGGIAKIFYSGPMFRYERPQKGRYRQFYQIGLEALGGAGPLVDAEVITLLSRFFKKMGVDDVRILVNSLGCPSCRPVYRQALVGFLEGVEENLCSNCVRRITVNPLRVLDCKVPSCREAMGGAPEMLSFLCADCREHFSKVTGALEAAGVVFTIDPGIVRGLDYYSRTAFEAVCDRLGAQSAVAAGGRYDLLAAEMGGNAPGIGFALGVERLGMLMDWESRPSPVLDFFVAAATPASRTPVLRLAERLRAANKAVGIDLEERSLKAQMRQAGKTGAARVIILGDDEMRSGTLQIRDFKTGTQETVTEKEFFRSFCGEPFPTKGES